MATSPLVTGRYHDYLSAALVALKRNAPHPCHLVDVLDDQPLNGPPRLIVIARDLTERRGNAYITWRFNIDDGSFDDGHYGQSLDMAVEDAYERLTR